MRLKQFLSQPVTIQVFLFVQVVSMLLTLAVGRLCINVLSSQVVYHPIQKIIQVGQEKQALSTEYLLELLGLSFDKPSMIEKTNDEDLLEKIKKSPLIESVSVETLYPDAIYLEYKTRRPFALFEDFKNTAIDQSGCIFPIRPFLTAKKLPKIYLGIKGGFDQEQVLSEIGWNKPIKNPKLDLAFSILDFIQQSDLLRVSFRLQRVDVSKAFEKSFGKRSITLVDEVVLNSQGTFVQKTIIRLHHKQFTQGLLNYVEWKNHYLKAQYDKIDAEKVKKTLIIDLRIPQMAFIEEM